VWLWLIHASKWNFELSKNTWIGEKIISFDKNIKIMNSLGMRCELDESWKWDSYYKKIKFKMIWSWWYMRDCGSCIIIGDSYTTIDFM
jgi:hypothetical protein